MYEPWIFTSQEPAQPVHQSPAPRYPIASNVQIFLRFESWQLRWVVKSIDISSTGLRCSFPVTSEQSATQAVDLETLLHAEPTARLQIDHGISELFTPVLLAEVVRTQREQAGLEIFFRFSEADENIASLIAHLRSTFSSNSQRELLA